MNEEERNDLARKLQIPPKEQEILDEASTHMFNCRCEICRQYWELVGPDESGSYGPFAREEIE